MTFGRRKKIVRAQKHSQRDLEAKPNADLQAIEPFKGLGNNAMGKKKTHGNIAAKELYIVLHS